MEARLEQYSSLFSSMIDLIPPNYYLCKEEEFIQSNKYFHKTKKRKEISKESLIKAKKSRLDPSERKTVEEIKREMEEEKMETEKDEGESNEVSESSLKLNLESIESVPLSELRERLSLKIKDCQFKRKMKEPATKTKKGKGKESDKKVKKKKKDKEGKVEDRKSISQTLKPPKTETESGQVLFNKFEFRNLESSNEPRQKKKRKKESTEQLLVKAKERERKLCDLTETDPEKGKELKEKIKWRQAMMKAQGVKEKTDSQLLEKTLKKEKKLKEKSQKKWKERLESQKEVKEKKQAKRQKHIKERIDAKKAKNSKKKRPKGMKKVVLRS
ncbi:PREDICTED: ribosomal RNA-processing protein 14-C-like [Amphimedon queenslandica]|uniref:Ribosomal RNA-processing protein 14/surfeit locus protein 6 C-terminal domain-containing protein n=1 Tax=Amphimedon queenslandica TaxID=400682 RepID=A0A1X7V2K2_AMPQE|nr:PREDICTED: ribosomal RNA-processing protein 14-C-like [Amphimedon queenslandica]|eukprot:XP_011403391.1 PREDICTED: ribosomal RNA-processing protein 14-C-like [Amphimedon queenslandica]